MGFYIRVKEDALFKRCWLKIVGLSQACALSSKGVGNVGVCIGVNEDALFKKLSVENCESEPGLCSDGVGNAEVYIGVKEDAMFKKVVS